MWVAWCAANRIHLPADRLIAQVDGTERVAQYWPPEPLGEQGSVIGLFDSALDANRLKHSHLYNVARHRWTKWRRRTLRRHFLRACHALRSGRPPRDQG